MCSTSLDFRFCDDLDRWWQEAELPEEMEEWLWRNTPTLSLGGTYRHASTEEKVDSYRRAIAFWAELSDRYPDWSEKLLCGRFWHCHGEEAEQIYRSVAELEEEIVALESGRGLSSLPGPTYNLDKVASVISVGVVVEKRDAPPLTFPDDYYEETDSV